MASEEEGELLARCTVFRGGFSLEATLAVSPKRIARHAVVDALGRLEASSLLAADRVVGAAQVLEASDRRRIDYDRSGDQHYDHASAYIKSMRASDPEMGAERM